MLKKCTKSAKFWIYFNFTTKNTHHHIHESYKSLFKLLSCFLNRDPYDDNSEDDDEEEEDEEEDTKAKHKKKKKTKAQPIKVDIDLGLSAYANARKWVTSVLQFYHPVNLTGLVYIFILKVCKFCVGTY